MTRSRRARCGHGDDDLLFPVSREPNYDPADPTAADAAVTHLAEVLNALPGPLDGAIAELTPHDIATILSRAPMNARTHALQALGMPRMAPRAVGQALCRDILARLERVHIHDARHATYVLTGPVRSALQAATKTWAGAYGVALQPDTIVAVADFPDALWRLALWAVVGAAVSDARMLLWASTQQWWLPQGLSEAHGDAVVRAAQAVIDATPDFGFVVDRPWEEAVGSGEPEGSDRAYAQAAEDNSGAGDDGVADADGARGEPAACSETAAALPVGTPIAEKTDSIEEPDLMAEQTAKPSIADAVSAARRDWEQLAATHAVAVDAAHRLAADVEAGVAPDAADLTAVGALRDGLQALAVRVAAAPVGDAADTTERASLSRIDAALEALERAVAHGSVKARLTSLHRLAPVTPNPTLAAQVAELQALVAGAEAAEVDGQLVEALLALADLAAHITGVGPAHADTQAAFDLQSRAVAGLPSQLTALPVAVLTGQLTLADGAGPRDATAAAALVTAEPALPDTPARAAQPLANATQRASAPAAATGTTGIATAGPAAQTADAPAASVDDAEPARSGTLAEPEPQPVPRSVPRRPPPAAPAQPSVPATPPAATTAPEPAPQPVPELGDVTAAVSSLVVDNRFGLAAALSACAGWSAARTSALRLAALANAVRSEAGPSAARLRAELADTDHEQLAAEAATLLLAVPALLRAALVTGDPTTGALLTALAPRLEDNLGEVAKQVGRRALQGLLMGNPLRTVLADVSELEANLNAARDAARERLRPRTLRFKRATDIAHRWLAADGILGRLLTAAAGDDRSQVGAVTADVLRLSEHTAVAKEIDTLDNFFKGHSGKPIEGAGRQDLFTIAADALAQVSAWLEAVAALERSTHDNAAWATTELTEMRAAVLAHADAALTALDEHTAHSDALAGAAAVAARASIDRTFALLDGTDALTPGEPLPDVVLTGELLKVPGATVEPTSGLVTVPDGARFTALVDAVTLDWPAAFAAKLDAEEYPAAEYLLRALRAGAMPGADGLDPGAEEALMAAEHSSRGALQGVREQLLAELRRARLQNEISEEQDGELTGMLDGADPRERRDLDVVRRRLDALGSQLPHYREEAARRLEQRLHDLVEQPSRVEVDVAHIQRLIDDGQVSTAEELIYFLEVGEAVPSTVARADLTRFFPAVPDALPTGLTPAAVAAASAGGVLDGCPVLDFARLSPETRADVAAALDAWRLAGSTPAEGRSRVDERTVLLPALRLTGFEFEPSTKAVKLDVRKGRDRRFVELTDVSIVGKAMVPQFGSALRGRLRVLLVWGQPAEDLLMSYVDQDTSGDAVLVAYFGTMPAEVRRRLAARAVRTDAPVAVLDDAALAYLAAHGDRQMDAAMSVLLPFSAVQPYVRHKRSLVAPEMFYGRDSERKAVQSQAGTQVIFGGRGLGKSALLRDAKAHFEREPGRIAIHIELTTAEIGPDKQSADAVWDVLLRDLETAGVVTSTKAARKGKSNHEIVRAGVLEWLSADTRHQLLVLLDESDGFFETDAPRFLETNRLKDLGQMAGVEGRAKVVFAGLHSVQRFAKMSNNTFKHLAQRPTVIGPLRPQFAYNLIARPMEVLGYTFGDPDLVNRILGYCSYQPFLLQMFGHRLVEHMHARREAGVGDGQPPFTATRTDVEAVEADPDLKADITSTFSDTLNLDPRYNVIANVLAWQAHERGMDHRLSDVELREECRSWWPAGFSGLDVEAFRAYLHEMVGLGVLAPNNGGLGWHLRSPNVLRMIGPQDQVMAELVQAASETVPSEFIAMSTRRALPDGTRAPLTAGQVDDLLGDHANQVRLVLGSTATGVEKVAPTLRAVRDDLAGRYNLIDTKGRKQFEEALVDGRPGERRVVLSDLLAVDAKDATCGASLRTALRERPGTPGVTRAVVIVSGADQVGFWQEALAWGERQGLGVVSLRRFDRRTLRVWSLDTGRFATDERQARLLAVTGGWPLLVERAVDLAVETESEDAALVELERELASPDGAGDLVDAVGLTVDAQLAAAFDSITALVDAGASLTDLTDAASLSGHPDPAVAVAALEALAVFDVDDDGAYRVDRVLVRCWPFRRAPVSIDA